MYHLFFCTRKKTRCVGVVQESVRHVAQSLHTNPKYARGVSLTELRISTWRCYSPGAQLDCLQVLIACLQDKLALLLPRPPLQDAELAADWAVFAASQPRDSSHLCFARHQRRGEARAVGEASQVHARDEQVVARVRVAGARVDPRFVVRFEGKRGEGGQLSEGGGSQLCGTVAAARAGCRTAR